MRNCHDKVVVPVAALRPLLQKWVEQNTTESEGCAKNFRAVNKGITKLSEETGIPARKLSGILNDTLTDNQKNVTFDVADKLLCAIQMNSEWHVSLAEYYVELEVAPYERDLASGRAA